MIIFLLIKNVRNSVMSSHHSTSMEVRSSIRLDANKMIMHSKLGEICEPMLHSWSCISIYSLETESESEIIDLIRSLMVDLE